jgi:hypothetical protein
MLGGFPIPGPDRLDIEVTITHGEVQNPSLTGRFDPRHKAHSGRRFPEPASCEPTLAIEDEVSEWWFYWGHHKKPDFPCQVWCDFQMISLGERSVFALCVHGQLARNMSSQ